MALGDLRSFGEADRAWRKRLLSRTQLLWKQSVFTSHPDKKIYMFYSIQSLVNIYTGAAKTNHHRAGGLKPQKSTVTVRRPESKIQVSHTTSREGSSCCFPAVAPGVLGYG